MYVGAFRRWLALLIDSVVVSGIFLIVLFIMKALLSIINGDLPLDAISAAAHTNLELPSGLTLYTSFLYSGIYAAIWLIYEMLFVNSRFSATPGKVVLGMEIACYRGASLIKTLIRSILKVLSLFSLIGGVIEYIIINHQIYRQSLHDMATSTLVSMNETKEDVDGKNLSLMLDEFEKGNLDNYGYILELKSKIAANREAVKDTRSYKGISLLILVIMLLVISLFVLLNIKII